MKNIVISFLLSLLGLSNQALAVISTCDVGYPPNVLFGYETPYHNGKWSTPDHTNAFIFLGNQNPLAYVVSRVSSPGSPQAEEPWMDQVFGAGQKTHYVSNPQNNTIYTFSGDSYLGWYDQLNELFYYVPGLISHCDGPAEAVNNFVQITVGRPALLTLNDDYTMFANYTPTFLNISNYKIEIKRTAQGSQWYTLYSGSSSSFSSYAKAAGTFIIRYVLTNNGVNYTSSEFPFTIQFFDFNQIASNIVVENAALAAWASIKADTNRTQRIEKGFWIRFNTVSRAFETTTPLKVGFPVYYPSTLAATVSLGTRPPDSITSPSPIDSPVYTVGSFHGHSMLAYYEPIYCKAVGPSTDDADQDYIDNVVGLVGDYIGTFNGSNYEACGGWPNDVTEELDAQPRFYPSGGPTRRTTP